MLNNLVAFFISYLIGSVPTAYLVVKSTAKLDIRTVGSGNVGGRNALEVTGNKWVGIVVVIVDLLKGVLAVGAAGEIFPGDVTTISVAMSGVVFGHCYPIWLRFQGGRGLATAAGVFLMTSWAWVAVWFMIYFVFEKVSKNVHAASVIALVGSPLVVWLLPNSLIVLLIPSEFTVEQFFVAGILVMAVCLSRHIEPMKEFGKQKTDNEK